MSNGSDSFLSKVVNFFLGPYEWHQLPVTLGLAKLVPIRNALRQQNLFDLEDACPAHADSDAAPEEKVQFRSFDGTYNDLECPQMGAEETSFGRNVPLDEVDPETDTLMEPSPRTVSRKLLARDQFKPVKILNLLAASWIQFQVHDWFAHVKSDHRKHQIPLDDDDPWPHETMDIEATEPATSGDGQPPAYANRNTHWWDGSQIYGSSAETAKRLRTGSDGKMKMGDEALLPLDVDGVVLTGFHDNWWIGLSMLHALFVAEHNAICDRLKRDHPSWEDERLFQQARLINAALLAKIHTIEWTPAILPHPTVSKALNINWDGVVSDGLKSLFPFLDHNEVLGGIPRSPTNHHGTPYSLTEEFVGVYRMHPLLPDDFHFHSAETGESLGEHSLTDVSLGNTRNIMETYELRDLFYSFGIAHPGALKLHNYPQDLRSMTRPDGTDLDLAAIDVLRDRERGLPRYNDFREMLRMDRVTSFEELTGDPETAAQVKAVYDGDIDKVDLMVGLFAEPLLEGFGFSETAFRIFIVMASRRLKSDRFFTSDFTEERYTKAGLEWIEENTMLTVLKRHLPELKPALQGVDNAFQPWNER
jgi:hypothetical protein